MPIDYGDYPKNWKTISRFIRFHRARNKCERCGRENGMVISYPRPRAPWYITPENPEPKTPLRKVVLTVAHLFDMDKKNGKLLNLAALCQKCHLHLDKYHHQDKRREKHKDPVMFSPEDIYGVKDRKRLSRIYNDRFVRRIRHERNAALWFLHKNF